MNLQETADLIVTKLAAQGKRCVNEKNACVYRSSNGYGCAIGIILPDKVAKKLDSLPIDGGDTCMAPLAWEIMKPHLKIDGVDEENAQEFYFDMQKAHDSSNMLRKILERMHDVYLRHNLDPTKIKLITKWS